VPFFLPVTAYAVKRQSKGILDQHLYWLLVFFYRDKGKKCKLKMKKVKN